MLRTRPARLPHGLIATLALIAFIEHGITRRELDFRHPWAWDWHLSGRAARRASAGNDVLCLGDSMMKFAIAPNIQAREIDGRVYNLAIGAAPPPVSYFQLKRAYEAGARPRVVLVDFIPHLLAKGPYISQRLWPEYLDWHEAIDLSRNARDARLFGMIAAAKLLPSVRDRMEIRAGITEALAGRDASARAGVLENIRNWRENRGAEMVEKRTWPAPDFSRYAPDLYPDAWHPAAFNVTYVERLLSLAAAHGTTVVVLIPPFNEAVRRERERKGLDVAFDDFLRNLQSRHADLVVIDARSSDYNDAVHYDPIHLDREGAAALTRAVAGIIRPHLDKTKVADAPRWVLAPKFEHAPQLEAAPMRVAGERRIEPRRATATTDRSIRE